jgi:3-dehydroquinate dehydratase-2
MTTKILIINGPNLNLLGKREENHYGKTTFEELKGNCQDYAKNKDIELTFKQTNIEGEIVSLIQESNKKFDALIINAAGYTHTSVAIRDALVIFKKPSIELHISNIYKREEFRQKSMISDVVTGIICGLGTNGYILAINAMHELLNNGNR